MIETTLVLRVSAGDFDCSLVTIRWYVGQASEDVISLAMKTLRTFTDPA